MPSTPIGLIGLSLMGTALAKRLRGAGYAVLGFDIVPTRRNARAALAATPAASIAELPGLRGDSDR